jgi:hypothetical protein
MGAAFLPALSDTIDVNKLPSAEVITRHLSPTVMSQSYRGDGYVAESVGSVPLYPTVIGAIATSAAAGAMYHQQTQGGGPPIAPTLQVMPPSTPSATPDPRNTP